MKRYLPALVLVVLAAIVAAPVLTHAVAPPHMPMVASQRFVWQQPLPQGNPIDAIDFVSGVLGWAVGDNGTVLKTTDGGFSWTNQGPIVPQGGEAYTDNATDVCFVDANNGWIAIGPHLYRTTNGGTTWAPTSAWIADDTGKYYLYQCVDFADANNGWFLGSYQMFHTTDGGATVTKQTLPGGATPYEVAAASSTQAFAYEYNGEGYLSTADGGATWEQRYFTGTAYEDDGPESMAVCSGSTLYAAFPYDLLKTTNGGSTWTTVTVDSASPGDYFYQLFGVDGDTGGNNIFLSTDGAGFHYTTDGGVTWHESPIDPNTEDFDAPSSTTLFRVDQSRVYGSTSRGDSWYQCFGPQTQDTYQSIDFTSKTTGHAITGHEYARTTDGGTNWTVSTMADKSINLETLNAMTFLESNPSLGWILGTPVGASGLPSVYKTTDAGLTWQSQDETTMAGMRRVRFSDADNGWAIYGYQDGFWHSADGGNSWAKVPHQGNHWDLDFADANNGWIAFSPMFATSDIYVMHTENGGSTWTTQTVGTTGGTLMNVDFADANTGYAVDSFANIFKSTNGGDTWTEIDFWPWAPDFRIYDIKFTTPSDGWVVGEQLSSSVSPSYRHDFAAHTTDGGQTWDFYDDAAAADNGSTGTRVNISVVDAFGDDAWIAGSYGSILKTRHRPVAAITSKSKTLSTYRQSTVVTGTLTLDGKPVVGKKVELWTSFSSTGTFVKSSLSATTGTWGTYWISVAPYSATYYKVKFAGDSTTLDSALSGSVKVTPVPSVGTPKAPKTMSKYKYYTVYGYLKPKHTSGSKPVKIQCYKKNSSGVYKYHHSVYAKASNYSTYSKYKASVKLPHRGKWRVRAYAPADTGHAAKYSGYDYVTVP